MMLSANDLMTLYVGIETLSLSSYVLAAFRRDSMKSAEAGLKYFVLGALASGLLLYGSSLVYGFTGGTGYAVRSRLRRPRSASTFRPRVPDLRSVFQGFGCAVPHLDARRL